MGILKKLLLSISLVLVAVFVLAAVVISVGVGRSNDRMVSALGERLQADNHKSRELLDENARAIAESLDLASETTREIILGLYDSTFNSTVAGLTNQLFPMVENFDYDSPRQVVQDLIASNPAITAVRFFTAEEPGPYDTHEIGGFAETATGCKVYSVEKKGDFAYLKVEMQVSLAAMEDLENIDLVFYRINEDNRALVDGMAASSSNSLARAQTLALALGDEAKRQLSLQTALVFAIILVLVCAVVGVLIRRLVTRPLDLTVGMLEEMCKGHLNGRLNMKQQDEIGCMARAMDRLAECLENEVVGTLAKLARGDLDFSTVPCDEHDMLRISLNKVGEDLDALVRQIQDAGSQIALGAAQISDSSQTLSHGATTQASSLQEVSASLHEMGAQVQATSDNAEQADILAGEARQAAAGGQRQMEEMVTAMDEISAASQNISKIIKTIDEIAFQTNLLALNAAVEAARAGQHGKGFAVVAEEVRTLAARSAKAAAETSELIGKSVGKTKNGAEIADRTAQALDAIVGGVGKVSDLIGEINAATSEQAGGISQVNQGLSQIDKVTQQNTANAEESAAAAEELSSQSAQLKKMLGRFYLKRTYSTATAPPAALSTGAPKYDVEDHS